MRLWRHGSPPSPISLVEHTGGRETVLPWPSAENFIDYADLAHVASAGVVVGYLVAAPNVGKRLPGHPFGGGMT